MSPVRSITRWVPMLSLHWSSTRKGLSDPTMAENRFPHFEITLTDGSSVRVSAAVQAQDPRWEEKLRDLFAAKWAAHARRQGIRITRIPVAEMPHPDQLSRVAR